MVAFTPAGEAPVWADAALLELVRDTCCNNEACKAVAQSHLGQRAYRSTWRESGIFVVQRHNALS